MSKYIKPQCDLCGVELELCQEYIYYETRKILGNGMASKQRTNKPHDDMLHTLDILRCPNCTLRYELDFNEHGQIIKVGHEKVTSQSTRNPL
ncbi:hypothetical protein Elgi_37550 [Paenibacillus elgii]|nr:hypothetical protein Elgi_37550 [Paenibacillus elgii]